MWATVSQASTAASSDSKMSRQRITTIGSVPLANSEATASRRRSVALVLEPVDLDQMRRQLAAGAQAAERLRDLLGGADEHVGELDRLLHRGLDRVQAERVGDLLGVVDDVVERGRQPVTLAGVERRADAPAARQPMDHIVGDAVALVLALAHLLRERRALGVVGQQIAQQQRRAQHVAARFLEQVEQALVHGLRSSAMISEHYARGAARVERFTTSSRLHHSIFTRATRRRASCASLMPEPGDPR